MKLEQLFIELGYTKEDYILITENNSIKHYNPDTLYIKIKTMYNYLLQYYTKEEIIKMTEICNDTFVNFIKTSTGFSEYGAKVEDVELINDHRNEVLEIKASGGIRDIETAEAMINAGATRLGTSSGVKLMEVECDCDCHECHCHDEK